jgi:hypothetical protein
MISLSLKKIESWFIIFHIWTNILNMRSGQTYLSNPWFNYMFGATWFEGPFYIFNMRIRMEVTKNVMVHVNESPIILEYHISIFFKC